MKFKVTKFSLFSIILFFCFYLSTAQSPLYKNYNVKEGLPSSETYEVFQDSKGYIWIATDRGVSRFDGYEFKTFTTEDGLPDNVNFGFYEDTRGRIWLKAYSNKLCYYQDGSFHTVDFKDPLPVEFKNRICNSLFVDQKEQLWIGFESGNCYLKVSLNRKDGNYIPEVVFLKQLGSIYLKEIKGGGFLYGCAEYGNLQINSQVSRRVFVKEDNTEVLLEQKLPKKLGASSPITRMAKTQKKMFIVSRGPVIHVFNSDSTIVVKSNYGIVISLMKDEKESLWVGIKNEGVLYFSDITTLKNPIRFLDHISVSSVMKDKDGGYWFSTLENGVFYIANINFRHLTQADGLSINKVNCLAVSSDNKLYLGLNNGKVDCIEEKKVKNEIDCSLLPKSINNISSIACLNNGWVVVGGSGLSIIKKNHKPKLVVENAPQGYFAKKVFPLDSGFLFASYSTLMEINTFKNCAITKQLQVKRRIYSVLKDRKGIIWTGTLNGLFRYDGVELTSHLEKNLNFRIDDLKEDKDSYLWIASKGKGLFIVKENHVLFLDKKIGLASNFCSSIFIDSDNVIWVGTNKGVSKITVENYKPFSCKIKNYSTTNGLISNEINQIVVKGDSVYVATNDGVTIFNKKKVSRNEVEPPIYINKFQVNDSIYSLKNNYALNYGQNFIKINFIGLSYKDPGNIEYKYRLIGLDTIWQYSKHTSIDYTSLPYGAYKFEVQARNSNGDWRNKIAHISFIIAPPFWQTWWFSILTAFAIMSFVFLFIKYRIRLVEKRAHEKMLQYQKIAADEKEKLELYQKASDMEMRFLSSQMNPHFTFNAMNSIQKFILNKEPLAAQRYLAQYSKLIRRVLENNMKKFVALEQEIEMLELYLEIESTRFEKKFDFEIVFSVEFEDKEYEIPPMIIQPYVENAIWHGLANKENDIGKITLKFSLENECIKCVIEDNGIGREKAGKLKIKKEHTSVGMLITSQRLLQLHSNDNLGVKNTIFDVIDSEGFVKGTKVEVYLPIYKEDEIRKVPRDTRDFSVN